ncbi:MAG: transporter permease, partial [Rhizobacter sp.]|nr:transporter permease [Rhizobacter sp.]
HAVVVLLCIAVLDFLLLQLAPGNAADVLAGESGGGGDAAYMVQLRERFGLDKPVPVQLGYYMLRLVQGDLGYSARSGTTVAHLIMARLPATLGLMSASLVLAVIVGAALGVLAARRPNSPTDNAIAIISMMSYATPLFWLGLMLIALYAVTLRWLPTGGLESVGMGYTGWAMVVDLAKHAVLPVVTLGLFFMAVFTRLVRTSVLEVKEMDYVRMARAKGLSAARVTWRHVFRNAMLPLVTMLSVQVGAMLGGAVVVEMVFGWPGLGRLAFDAVLSRDLNLLLGIVMVSAVLVVVINIAVDLLYARLDPRIEVR